uniref:Neuralized E3 ubiquitin protein ligase 1B n=1 Tax=Sinocyclocheilus anshuiensis TaxID=1608454 RepID=A0A671SGB6_9TELE
DRNVTPRAYSSLQHRPVASRQYCTVSKSGVKRHTSAPPNSIESPRFHPHAKGKNIRLDTQLRRATRKNSFCNGITFSQRPVRLYEKVRLRLSGVHTGWSGALRFGFTSLDPSKLALADIPKYACPDLVTRPGYWAKALGLPAGSPCHLTLTCIFTQCEALTWFSQMIVQFVQTFDWCYIYI